MTQSVELLLDPASEAAVRQEWLALHQAGLPSEVRPGPDDSHRPHITLFAAAEITPAADQALPALVADLHLSLQLGALMLFGPHRDRFVLVHAVVPSNDLLELQRVVGRTCGADRDSYFAPGRWAPHVTVARRVTAAELPAALSALAPVGAADQPMRITQCRRWDGVARRSWLLTSLSESYIGDTDG